MITNWRTSIFTLILIVKNTSLWNIVCGYQLIYENELVRGKISKAHPAIQLELRV